MNYSFPALLAPVLIIVIVIIINVSLFYAFRSKSTRDQIELLKKASSSARHPWKKEEEDMKELAARVNKLQSSKKPDSVPSSKDKQG
jgi:hypothetical protein